MKKIIGILLGVLVILLATVVNAKDVYIEHTSGDGVTHQLSVNLDPLSGKIIMEHSFSDAETGDILKYNSKIYIFNPETGQYEKNIFIIIDNNGQAKTICNGYLCWVFIFLFYFLKKANNDKKRKILWRGCYYQNNNISGNSIYRVKVV